MNIYQSLNTTIFGGTLAALVAGLFKTSGEVTDQPLTLWLFIAFFVLLRMKIFLDDYKYFGTTETRNPHFKTGFLIGFISWMLGAIGGYAVFNLRAAYLLVGAAIGTSTIWIVIVALRKGAYREQYYWFATNTIFMLLLWNAQSRNQPQGDLWTWASLGIALLWVAIDLVASNSFPELDK
jgi:hypothetical protein